MHRKLFTLKALSELGDVEKRCWQVGQGFTTNGYFPISSSGKNFPHRLFELQILRASYMHDTRILHIAYASFVVYIMVN